MWKAEEDFPRGGAKLKKKFKKQDDGSEKDYKNKYEVASNNKPVSVKKSNKFGSKKRKYSDSSSESPTLSKRPKIDNRVELVDAPLRLDLAADICVLGCVRQVHDYSISLSLPGNLVGTLPITEISASYTQLLETLAHSEDSEGNEEVRPADELFKPGMLLPVFIKDIMEDKQRSKKIIKLSIVPSNVNGNIPLKAIEDGMLLFGSVTSVEDHGYRIDLGVKGIQTFLTASDAEKFIQVHHSGSPLCVGDPVWCVLKMKDSKALKAGESRVINVTIDPDIVQQAKMPKTSNLNSLVPGTSVTGTVQSITDNGLHVDVFGFNGMVHSSQLTKACNQYKTGEEIQLRVLYTSPISKILHLSALTQIVQFNGSPLHLFGDLAIGNIVDGIVIYVVKKKGIYFRLPDHLKGFAVVKQLSDDENPDIAKYHKGLSCKCRVIGFNFMEGVALVTLKQSVLKQKFLSVQEMSVADIIHTVVSEVTPNGVVVKLSKGLYSFVSCLHLADVPIKHPEKKFETGMKMKCRVLRIDHDKSKVFLTHKQSLIKSKYQTVTDYSQLQPGQELEGYIVAVKEAFIVVAFFGNVKGIVPLKEMSTEQVVDPSTMFYTGQVVRCRVVHYSVPEKKLKLSFNFGTKKSSKNDPATDTSDFKVGKVVGAKVLRIENDSFRLLLQPKKSVAILPFCHLSDYHEIQELKKLAIRPGQQLDKVMYFSQKPKTIVTMKESIFQAAEEKILLENFEDLKTGMLLPAVIKNHQDYGMFLELAAGHTGLCPAKILTYLQPSSLPDLFQPGQSVVTRLSKIDYEKKRFLGSVRLDACYQGGIDASVNLLKTYLSAKDEILDLLFAEHGGLSMYKELNVGNIVDVTVSSSLKKGILGDLPSGAKALATKVNLGGLEPKVGDKCKAVVLFVDLLTPCVELSLDQKLVKAVTTRKENVKTELKSGQILKADVLLVKPEFMLMSLRGHGSGKFVHVPVRQHINDVDLDGKPYEPGTFTEVVIKNSHSDYHLAVLKSLDPEIIEMERIEKINLKNMPRHNMKPGMIVDAKIKVVHPLQLNILVNNLHGRIHITEIVDTVEEGEFPLKKFRQQQELKVKVIGLRDLKSHSYLPITHPKSNRTLLECTFKTSKINSESEADLLAPKLHVKIGDKISAYVIKISGNKVWCQVSLTQQGYIDMFHLSTDVNVLNDVNSHFKTGQAHKVMVLECDNDDRLVLSKIDDKPKITIGEPVTAQITSIKPGEGLYVKLAGGRLGVVQTKPSVLNYVGQFIRCQVKDVEDLDRCILSLLDQSQVSHVRSRKRKRELSLSETGDKIAEKKIIKMKKLLKMKKKEKKSEEGEEQGDSGVDVAKNSSDSDKEEGNTVAREENKAPRLSMKGFSWKGELPVKLDDDKVVSDDDDDDDVKVDVTKLKKKRKRDEEKIIEEYERSQLEGSTNPTSANDFEKLMLQSPNSSVVWLRYMAFHIEQGEIEKARAVAEKAINTVSFREEQEKKNIWLAYLNMETTYGEASDVKKLLERAITYNDALDINLKMCDIYVAAGKMEDAELLYAIMSRKYKRDKAVWKSYAQFLFKAGKALAARKLLQRCVSVLDKKDHVEVIAKFANLEFTDGDKERGRTMFENLIASYPGRTDLWSVYVDMVAKVGDIEGARQILERAVKQKLTTKRLSFLIQKYIRFEEAHGTEDQVQRVKDMALKLFES